MRLPRATALALALLATPGCRCSPEPTSAPPAQPPPAPRRMAPAPEATVGLLSLVEAQGNVWRTSPSGERRAISTGQLSAGDQLAADPDGNAVLRLQDGRELVLGPGSRLRVKRAAGAAVEVELEQGEVLSRSGRPADDAAAVSLTVLTPLGITRLPATPAEARIALQQGRVGIDVAMGEIAFLDRSGREVTARAHERIEVDLGGLQLLPARRAASRPPADVILPTQRGLRVYSDGLREVTLSWPAELAGAEVQVASDPAFKRVIRSERSTLARLTVPAPRQGELHWRVVSGDGEGARELLGQARFQLDRPRSTPGRRRLHNIVDESGQTTTVYYQSTRPDLTFVFATTLGAVRYRLRIYQSGQLDRPLLEREVRENRCTVPANTLEEGDYLWHAQPLDADGRLLGGGRMNKLALAYDNSLQTLAISSPRSGEVVAGGEVTVSGVAPLGSRLYLNGTAVTIDDKGRFQIRARPARRWSFAWSAGTAARATGSETFGSAREDIAAPAGAAG